MPPDLNMIFGMTHFIKTVEDLYEAIAGISTTVEFGIGFCEASGPCLIRSDGNNDELIKLAEQKAYDIACLPDKFPPADQDDSGGCLNLLCHRQPGGNNNRRNQPGTGSDRRCRRFYAEGD